VKFAKSRGKSVVNVVEAPGDEALEATA